jgi:hypothetical protein
MTLPSLLFGLLIALLVGSLFHLLRGGGLGKLLLYLVLSVAGFAAGHLIGEWRTWILFPLGALDLGMALIGSLIFLGVGDWLGRIEIKTEDDSQL